MNCNTDVMIIMTTVYTQRLHMKIYEYKPWGSRVAMNILHELEKNVYWFFLK